MSVRLVAIILLFMVAGGMGYASLVMLSPPAALGELQARPSAPAPTVRYLVAATRLQAGTLMKEDDLREVAVPAERAPDIYIAATAEAREDLNGAMIRRHVEPGEIIRIADVIRPRDRGFLAAVLKPGHRAVTIGVDVVSGAAGLVWPGDEVDVLLTHELDGGNAGRRIVGETILRGQRVIAVNQQIAQGASGRNDTRSTPRTVTLEVTPDDAERVAVAQRIGRLSLSIRPLEAVVGMQTPERTGPLFGSDVSGALREPERAEPAAAAPTQRLRIIQGQSREEFSFR